MRKNENLTDDISVLANELMEMAGKFKTATPEEFNSLAGNFMEGLCNAYDLNDLKLNNSALKAYDKVAKTLREKLLRKSETNLTAIWHYTMVLRAFMDRFTLQAGRNYD